MVFKNKRVIISGGTLGIGKAVAQKLLENGARVVIFSRSGDHVKKTLRYLSQFGEVYGLPADVSDINEVEMIFEFAQVKLGGLDILINNAALAADSVEKTDLEEIEYIIKTNLIGYLNCAKLAAELMTNFGQIINIGSLSGKTRDSGGDLYVASKSGVEGFNDSLRRGLFKKGIKVTLIEPGAVATSLHGLAKNKLNSLVENMEMLPTDIIVDAIIFALSQQKNVDIMNIQIKPHRQNL